MSEPPKSDSKREMPTGRVFGLMLVAGMIVFRYYTRYSSSGWDRGSLLVLVALSFMWVRLMAHASAIEAIARMTAGLPINTLTGTQATYILWAAHSVLVRGGRADLAAEVERVMAPK